MNKIACLLLAFAAILVSVQAACTLNPSSNPAAPALIINDNSIKQTYLDNTRLQIRLDSTQQYKYIAFNFLSAAGTYGVNECDHLWIRPAVLGDPNAATTNTNNNWSDTVNGADCNIQFFGIFPAASVPNILNKCFAFDNTSDPIRNIYTANVRVTTRQDRPSIRNLPIERVTVTNLRFSFRFQRVTTISTQVSATGNVTVDTQVVEQIFNAFAVLDNNNNVIYPAGSTVVRMLTSVQYPYKLTVGGVGSATVGGGYSVTPLQEISSAPNAGVVSNCTDQVGTICYQLFETVVTQPSSVCNIATSVGFHYIVVCQPGFTGTCISAQNHDYDTTYSLTSNNICVETVEDIGLTGSLTSYALFADASAGNNPVNQFIFGQDAFFVGALSASAGSPSIISSTVSSVTVTSAGGSTINFPQNTANGYSAYSFSATRPAFQFNVNANTVALSTVDDAQNVGVSAVINVLFQNLQSEERHVTLALPRFALQGASDMNLATDVVVSSAAASDGSSTATSTTSLLAIVAGVVGGCILVAIIAGVVVYRRTTQSFVKELQGQNLKVMQVYVPSAASSSTNLTAETATAPATSAV